MTSVLCFCPDGTILIAFCNIPGAVDDSQVADYGDMYNNYGDMYNKLELVYVRDGAKFTVDSAFGNVSRA